MLWRGLFGGGAASGAAGALVASHNKGGQYVRARTTPTNPRTTFQTVVRSIVTGLTSVWRTLSPDQQALWNVYATNVSKRNRLGDSINVSGFNWFVGNNTSRLQAGLAELDAAPTIFDDGSVLLTGTFVTVGRNTTAGSLTLAGTTLPVDSASGGAFILFASRPISNGVSFFNGPYQIAATIPSNTSASVHSFTLPFAASNVGANPTDNYMEFVLRLARPDGRVSGKFFPNLE